MQWATDALDQIRRQVWNRARRSGHQQHARDLKGARWALWKGGERLTERQRAKLGQIEKTNQPLYRAYLLKDIVESLNTRIRLLTRQAFGFHSARPLIGLAMLSFGGLPLSLPGRAA